MNYLNSIKKWLYLAVFTADLLYLLVVSFVENLQIRTPLGYFLLCISIVLPLFTQFFDDND